MSTTRTTDEKVENKTRAPRNDPTTIQLFDDSEFTTNWSLRERFGVPPFSTLDTRAGYWKARRARWQELHLESKTGRADRLTFKSIEQKEGAPEIDQVSKILNKLGTTSEFDPLLMELILRWWTPDGGVILDPFAGGSTRGCVSGILGREYHGVDLNPEQVDANSCTRARLDDYLQIEPEWYVADSSVWQPDLVADAVVSCPPYGTLERYSDDPADLSTMGWEDFLVPYRRSIALSAERLRNDSFFVFVVGNFRPVGGDGHLRPLVAETIAALEANGLHYYGDLVVLNSTASSGLRASALFNPGRKPTFCHQHVVVAVKGSWRKAAARAERLDPLDVELGDNEKPYALEDGRR